DLVHQLDHLVMEDLAVFDSALERLGRGNRHGTSQGVDQAASGSGMPRKLRSKSWPCWVRIDSGWNCTPSISSVRWRRPMISSMEPSSRSVQAVTSRQSGTESFSTTSEW